MIANTLSKRRSQARYPSLTVFCSSKPSSRSRLAFSTISSRAKAEQQQPPQRDPGVVYSRPTTIASDRKASPIRIWPFVIIFAGGAYAFNELVKERSGTKSQKSKETASSRPF